MNHSTSCIIPQICCKPVTADFEGGEITSKGCLPALAAAERQMNLLSSMAACIKDTPSIEEMMSQRVLEIVSGYEDCNNNNRLRRDVMVRGVCPLMMAWLPSPP